MHVADEAAFSFVHFFGIKVLNFGKKRGGNVEKRGPSLLFREVKIVKMQKQ
ncbi:hypothetical protein HMPREF0083_01927 [Aneurinibacillus aneurinilyticus ATCC 12856]|jgi:hypothetical protein|uniref:Uncharacterized protein n=1 Tax=Aneurinibacillus aneurinilyticus ATCC 12856 TaxID=649747 RepID=U1WN16_ANEAE|nr:hypothetical protein HMPREF0083_01927 [Aneurinibacillus aneurinilyticus ATCC 12856]